MEETIQKLPAKDNAKKESHDTLKAANWLTGIIDSCTNTFHLKCCKILVKQYKEIYADKYGAAKYYDELLERLVDRMEYVE